MMTAIEAGDFIRESSKAGELVPSRALEAAILGHGSHPPDPAAEPSRIAALVQEIASGNDDVQTISDGSGGAWYFSDRFMTCAYARLVLLKTRGPIEMMAEVIREHSRIYPRPVPLALFECAPFSLSADEVALCLKEMAGGTLYRDIARVTTSIGTPFAYSTDHLEPAHAAMLAEWADVGQAQNP